MELKTTVPITMPSAIAIRMYCVNLLDIALPLRHPDAVSLADFKTRATLFHNSVKRITSETSSSLSNDEPGTIAFSSEVAPVRVKKTRPKMMGRQRSAQSVQA